MYYTYQHRYGWAYGISTGRHLPPSAPLTTPLSLPPPTASISSLHTGPASIRRAPTPSQPSTLHALSLPLSPTPPR